MIASVDEMLTGTVAATGGGVSRHLHFDINSHLLCELR